MGYQADQNQPASTTSDTDCGGHQAPAPQETTSNPGGINIDAEIAAHEGGAGADVNVGVAQNLGVLNAGDGSVDADIGARLASLSVGDILGSGDCSDGSAGAHDTGAQVALSSDIPIDVGHVGDLGLLGGDHLNLAALDLPSVDLCSLGDHI